VNRGHLLGVASGAILVPLNSTMLAVALPSVMGDFSVSASTVASLVTIYLGAVVVALPLAGAVGDRYGHRRIFVFGVIGFALASVLAATASAFVVLLVARILQAACGSFISTGAVALVRAAAPPERRGAAFGFFDMLVSVSAAVGPFVGGVIVGALDWRWMFLLAVPVAAAAALSVSLWHPSEPAARAEDRAVRPIDLPGLVLFAGLLAALLAVLLDRGSVTGLVAVAALPLLAVALAVVESRAAHPAIDPQLFRRPGYAAAVAGVLGATVILHGTFILVPLLVERVLLASPVIAGLVLLGVSGVSAVAAPFGGRASDRVGRRSPVVIGSAVTAVGLASLWLFVPIVPAGIAAAAVIAALLAVVGAGFGSAGSPRQAAAMDAVAHHEVGMAASTYYSGRYLGGVLGASLAGLVLGDAVSRASVALGFGLLAIVAVAVALVSLGLPSRPAGHDHAVADEMAAEAAGKPAVDA
jgi:EmrB/QacA subfamily drug resistance transporter